MIQCLTKVFRGGGDEHRKKRPSTQKEIWANDGIDLERLAEEGEAGQRDVCGCREECPEKQRDQNSSAKKVTGDDRFSLAMGVGRFHAYRGKKAEPEDHGHGKDGVRKGAGRQRDNANMPDHDGVRDAHKHLSDQPSDDWSRELQGVPVLSEKGSESRHGLGA